MFEPPKLNSNVVSSAIIPVEVWSRDVKVVDVIE